MFCKIILILLACLLNSYACQQNNVVKLIDDRTVYYYKTENNKTVGCLKIINGIASGYVDCAEVVYNQITENPEEIYATLKTEFEAQQENN